MWLVVAGVVLVGLKLLGLGFMVSVPWWLVLAPFALAAVWWKVADAMGITQRQAMDREDQRAAKRREAQFEALGMRPPPTSRPAKPDRPNRSDN
ncbi:MAG: TIGR04438 family Trp-rich protein [Aquabacterium sp.]|nr:TIGR04438 family Trp-rich protein [Aquabacterium sp.]